MIKEGSRARVALIGCGRIGRKHAELLGTGRVRGAELAAVCDIRPVRTREIGDQYRVPWFTDMHLMAQTVQPDLISLLTPSGDHAAHALELVQYHIPLLIEKPLALRLEDVDRVTEVYECHNTPLGEVKQNRYNVAVGHLKKAMDEGRLGTPRLASMRVWWSRDADYYQDWHGEWGQAGGVLANQAIHHIDLLCWLLGDVYRVSACAAWSDYADVETGLIATLEFENGCIGTIEATTLARPNDLEGSLAILGDEGTVELGGFAVNEIRVWQMGTNDPLPMAYEKPPDVYGFGHKALYEDVVSFLREGRDMPVNGIEARKALEVVHACYQSMETGKPVRLTGDYIESRLGR
jgi:predicted dehydrogenase